jgi:hypothetical protein
MALAHAITDKVEAAYRRGDLFEKRRQLMLDWARYCDNPKGEVVGSESSKRWLTCKWYAAASPALCQE